MSIKNDEKWFVSNTGTHQGLIINEETGESVAVSYKKEDAQLIASSPELLNVCKKTFSYFMDKREKLQEITPELERIERLLQDVINEAEGE